MIGLNDSSGMFNPLQDGEEEVIKPRECCGANVKLLNVIFQV